MSTEYRRTTTTIVSTLALAMAMLVNSGASPGSSGESPAPPDTGMTLAGDREETSLRSLTIEGENRIRTEFERPELRVEIDPEAAPGLVLGGALDVLNRTRPDRIGPFLAASASGRSPYLPRPWLETFDTGPVAIFNPQTRGIESWELTVVDSRGEVVRVFTGEGDPRDEIRWDGRDDAGDPVLPGLTFSYVFEAFDRAGNKKRVLGEGFEVSAYRLEEEGGTVLVLPGSSVVESGTGAGAGSPSIREVASWLNLRTGPADPVQVVAVARTGAAAEALAERIKRALVPLLPGESYRIALATRVAPGSPPDGAALVRWGMSPTEAIQ